MTTPQTPLDPHRPSTDFRGYLEWEITRNVRRGRTMRRARAAVLIIASVAVGSTATIASAQVRENTQRDSLLAAAQADASVVSLRLQLAQAQLKEVQRSVAVGAAPSSSLFGAELEFHAMEARANRAAVNIEEITLTSQPPRDELNAPVIDGHDFVQRRLELDVMVAHERVQSAERAQADAEQRQRMGVVSDMAAAEAALDLARANGDLAVLATRISLRREFLAKATPIDELTRRVERTQAQQDITVAMQALQLAQKRADLAARQRAVGAVQDIDVLKAQLDVKVREIEVQRLALRLRQLGSG